MNPKSKRILTRKTAGLDHRVWRTMLLLFILAAGLLSYTLIDTPKCTPVDFKIKTIDNDTLYETGEILSFSSSRFEKDISWDFNDNGTKGEGTFVTHRFTTEGKYFIKVTVNSDCQLIRPITIRKAVPDEKDNKIQIEGNSSTFVGVSESFSSLQTAKKYDWNVENHPEYASQNGIVATYKFSEPGDYTLILTLDNDRFKKYQKSIHVVENEAPPKPAAARPEKIEKLIDLDKLKPVTTFISEPTFSEYLEKVVEGDFLAKDFDNYLCSKGKTPVIMNGKSSKQVTFEQACAELNRKKNSKWLGLKKKLIKIKSVRLNRDEENCITLIEIKYE